MKIRIIIPVFSLVMLSFLFWWSQASATPNNLHIIPEISSEEGRTAAANDVRIVGNPSISGTAIERYTTIAKDYEKKWDIAKAMQTWIMGRNTLIQYVVYIMKFLSQLGLLIWGIMMLYAGYQYYRFLCYLERINELILIKKKILKISTTPLLFLWFGRELSRLFQIPKL